MIRDVPRRVGIAATLLAGALAVPAAVSAPPAAARVEGGADDAVVIAVIDSGLDPYHWDLSAAHMPQQRDGDPGNDLPLDQPPDTWLPGFPEPASLASYRALRLSLDAANPDADIRALAARDRAKWDQVAESTSSTPHYYWLPGTKVIGLLDFGGSPNGTADSHGAEVAAVSVGNLHGTCPECVLVFLSHDSSRASSGEDAIGWAMRQPWIDVITNSYGYHTFVSRDRLYSGSDTEVQRSASERGQTILFSAGNGISDGEARYPNSTLFSSQEGPDWIVTVGGTSPEGGNYTGTGKPADVSAIAEGYPSMGGRTATGRGTFGGTSNATPVVAGHYGRALWWSRSRLSGPSRVQEDGVVARGAPVPCGAARPECELAEGVLTARELRSRLLLGAVHTPQGPEYGFDEGYQVPVAPAEYEFLGEGRGTYWGRMRSTAEWLAELGRIVGPLEGSAPALARPDGEADWFTVDSYCRQELWGNWRDGEYRAGASTVPPPSPLWPLRSAYAASCAVLFPPA